MSPAPEEEIVSIEVGYEEISRHRKAEAPA